MNLRFDDNNVATEPARDVVRFRRIEGDLAARHRDTVARENGFGLVFVDFHDVRKRLMLVVDRMSRQWLVNIARVMR
jgi:hypothetical protein